MPAKAATTACFSKKSAPSSGSPSASARSSPYTCASRATTRKGSSTFPYCPAARTFIPSPPAGRCASGVRDAAGVAAVGVAAPTVFVSGAVAFLLEPHEAGAAPASASAAQTMTMLVTWFIFLAPQYLCRTPRTERTVSRAMSSSSSVGMT